MMKKFLGIIILCCMAMLFLSGCASSLYMRDHAVRENQALALTPVTETEEEPEAEEKPNTDQWARGMKSRWTEIDNHLNSDNKTTNSLGVSFYYSNSILKKVVVPVGTYGEEDIGYKREYYYDENGFFFAKLTKGSQSMRFYFKNGWLERWLDEVGKVVDRPSDDEEFARYDSVLFQEAENLQQIFSIDYQNLVEGVMPEDELSFN